MTKIILTLDNSFIQEIDKGVFLKLEQYLVESGVASDKDEFDVIKQNLISPPFLSPDDFAREVFYVILASGFRQKIAKKKYLEIVDFIQTGGEASPSNLLSIFGNKNKVNAICKVWQDRVKFCEGFYSLKTVEEKMKYLETLPHIGAITKNHIARNLGINEVKYDVWIQRLGIALSGNDDLTVGFPLDNRVKKVCDNMFNFIVSETNLPVGYIDVVLWKSCQIGLLSFK